MRLYQTTIKTRQYVTAAELSYESGYKSYSTFGWNLPIFLKDMPTDDVDVDKEYQLIPIDSL